MCDVSVCDVSVCLCVMCQCVMCLCVMCQCVMCQCLCWNGCRRTKAGVEEEEAKPRKFTISTQTGTGSIRRSAFTQTADEEHDN